MKRLMMIAACVCVVSCLGSGCVLKFNSSATAPNGAWGKKTGFRTEAAFFVEVDGKLADGAEGPLKSHSEFNISLTSEAKPAPGPDGG